MTDGTSVLSFTAGVLEDIEEEDNQAGWSDGPDALAALSPTDRAAFDALVEAYRMPDDEDDACPICTRWSCEC